MQRLTGRQERFVALYEGEGTGVHAARLAGYRGSEARLASTASRLLSTPRIADAVRARGVRLPGDPPPDPEDAPPTDEELEAEAVDPVAYWRRAMVDQGIPPAQRQRASERLAAHLERQNALGAEERTMRTVRRLVTEILVKKRAREAQEGTR